MKWTKESIISAANAFETRKAFRAGNPRAYDAARRHKILGEACAHMRALRVKRSPESVAVVAKKYATRNEFVEGDLGAYLAARKFGILEDVCAHMKPIWTKEPDAVLMEEAQKYSTRKAFQIGSHGAYRAALERGILDSICSHMSLTYTYWTDADIRKAAARFDTRSSFKSAEPSAYVIARKRGILEDACSHMPSRADWDAEAPTRLYWYLHPEGFVYIGISSDWDRRHAAHKESPHNTWAAWIAAQQYPDYIETYVEFSGAFTPAERPRTVMERAERLAIKYAAKQGWKVVNKTHNPQYDHASDVYSWE